MRAYVSASFISSLQTLARSRYIHEITISYDADANDDAIVLALVCCTLRWYVHTLDESKAQNIEDREGTQRGKISWSGGTSRR